VAKVSRRRQAVDEQQVRGKERDLSGGEGIDADLKRFDETIAMCIPSAAFGHSAGLS
jgi:hypothetical protein